MNKKSSVAIILCILSLAILSGCTSIGSNKTTDISAIYAITTVASLLLLIGYICFIKEKNIWFLVLFSSVFVVNSGYWFLSVSQSLTQAIWANRVSYLGSVFLPFSMSMIIFNESGLLYKKWVPKLLFTVSLAVFLIAASPGYLDIYYKSVKLESINGVSTLIKEYGPWHCVYLFYLVGYFGLMASVVMHAIFKKKIASTSHAIILVVSVFVNICVWLLEQFIKIDFEFLSVSYIITELFLLSVHIMLQQQKALIESIKTQNSIIAEPSAISTDACSEEFISHCNYIKEHLASLTPSEKAIYKCYLAGMSTKEVLKEMSISENTLKFHNKNIYSKLGVSSRKQLMEYAKHIDKSENN